MTSKSIKTLSACALLSLSLLSEAAGLMTPKNGQFPALEIKQHHVDVTIEDGYAITSVTQTFFNPNSAALEAIYSFPIPEKSAVGEFTYWIDGKPVTGEVLEKQQAHAVYEQEKVQGRETALTEQDEHKSFDSSVYPVMPQQDVKIRLVYIQPVHADHGIGSYVYPLEEGGVDTEKMAFWSYNDTVTEDFTFNLNIRSSYPIEDVRLPQHPQAIAQSQDQQHWQIALSNKAMSNKTMSNKNVSNNNELPESFNPNSESEALSPSITPSITRLDKDIVVYWRHQQGLPGSIDMVSHKEPHQDKGTFMMTVTPGDDLAKIEQGRDWVFVLDYSGSMSGKYQSLIEGVNRGLSKLKPNDRFRIILFNNSATELTSGYTAATTENVTKFTHAIETTTPNGGTNLYGGLEKGIRGLDSDRASAILLVTDGVANVGTTEKKAFLELLEQYDVRLFTFVMGNSANRPLLDGMTKISNGFATSVSNSDDIVGKLILATEKLNHQALNDVEIKIDGIKVRNMTPARIGSIYRGQQLIVFGHYWGEGKANVEITGNVSGETRSYKTTIDFPKQNQRNPEIERLWAYATIEDLQNQIDYLGEDDDYKHAIVDIAKEYGLVTNYTSLVVVREEVFKQLNISRDNAKRIEKETQAKQLRANQGVKDNRVDSQQPAFSNSTRAYPSSGGGSSSLWLLCILGIATLINTFRVKQNKKIEI